MAELTVFEHANAIAAARGVRFGVIRLEVKDGRVERVVEETSFKPEDLEGEVQLRG